MARAVSTDVFQSHRFHIRSVNGDTLEAVSEGGFQSITLPDVSLDIVEYKEGIMAWKRKYPGIPSVSDVTLTRGVARTRTRFWEWVLAAIQGGEYRCDLEIYHFHRDELLALGDTDSGNSPNLPTPSAGRRIKLINCFGATYKPGSDFDAMASEVSIEELTIACERFEVYDNNTLVGAATNIAP